MLRSFYIFLIYSIFLLVYPQEEESKIDIFYPEFIQYNSSFDFTILLPSLNDSINQNELSLILEQNLLLNYVEFQNSENKLKLKFTTNYNSEFNGYQYKVIIDLNDIKLNPREPFQLIYNFNSSNQSELNYDFYYYVTQNDSLIKKISLSSNEKQSFSGKLKFYQPQIQAGKSGRFSKQSNLNLELKDKIEYDLLIQFWIKFDNSETDFLLIKNALLGDDSLKLSLNEFQILSIESNFAKFDSYIEQFISLKNWYHITLYFQPNNRAVQFYLNGKLFSKLYFFNSINLNDFSFNIFNSDKKNIFIDELYFIDCQEMLEQIISKRNYPLKSNNEYKILYSASFNDEIKSIQNKSYQLISNEIKLVKSDAPIFFATPEINVIAYSNYHLIEWQSENLEQIKEYFLEKSIDGEQYQTIYKLSPTDFESKNQKFSFTDEKNNTENVVYYRLKQINKDGTIDYSSLVKLGKGKVETFTIKQNYPNPFNPKTTIIFELYQDSYVEVTIYNLEGQEIKKLYEGNLNKGEHQLTFDASNLPSGVYLYNISTPDYSQTKKMIFAK
ncbi:MAG: hypothetical protein STSR0008_20200 [Ignavibacterium sp.]